MLKCPKCKGATVIIDSRDTGIRVRRRHKCLGCLFRFTTHEVIEDKDIERQENLKKVQDYRKVYPNDKRSDEEILKIIILLEEKTPTELIHLATFNAGVLSEIKRKFGR